MKKKKNSYVLFLLLVLVLGGMIPSKGYAKEVQKVKTEGTIGFTGVYDPIGTPEPSPPDTIARPPSNGQNKPNGRLPQTNDQSRHWLTLLGIGFLVLIILIIFRRAKQEEQPNQ